MKLLTKERAQWVAFVIFTSAVVAIGGWIRWGHSKSELIPHYEKFGVFLCFWFGGTLLVFWLVRWLYARVQNKTIGIIIAATLLAAYQGVAFIVGDIIWVGR